MRTDRILQLTGSLAALLTLFAVSVDAADEKLFPRPLSLQPAIDFWTRVYSEVDSLEGYVHDSRNLGIVYETLHFKRYSSPRDQDLLIERVLQRYRQALQALAQGKREELDNDQQKALALWGDAASGESLRAAAANVRFQRGQADRFRGGIIRAGAWEHHIGETLQDLGLPVELAALPHVESSYNPTVRSAAGAAGLWQLTRFTGGHYLRVDHVLDERLDPLVATRAAARLLQKDYKVLKSWPLAITAYNHGLPGVRRAVRETGSRDIGAIVREYNGRRFGFASRNFYAAFLAALDVASDPEGYFGELQRQGPGDYWMVKVPAYLPVNALTRQLHLDADAFKTLNPSLQRSVWNGSKRIPKGYPLRLPAGTGNADISTLLTRIVPTAGYAKQIPDLVYKVQRGDTLSGIAQRHKVSVSYLMETNKLRSKNRIRAGQSLRLSTALVPEAVGFAAVESLDDSQSSASVVSRGHLPEEEGAARTVGDMRASGECRVNC